MARVQCEQLCAVGTRMDVKARDDASRLVEVIRILQDSEERHPENVDRYRTEVQDLKKRRNAANSILMQHVAHCDNGCRRTSGDASFAGEGQAGMFDRAPSHGKPIFPRNSELAAMLAAGATLDELAKRYERSAQTLRQLLSYSGFVAILKPRSKPTPASITPLVVDNRDWVIDALCAQVDPELWFPEKGGSTREARATCARCPVQVECREDALANNERFGVWGGLTNRERRKIVRREDGAA